jgi:hypothetical protein
MKIAIITQPLAYNIGGILQNFALQQVLRELGHEPITFDQTMGYVNRWKLIGHNILQAVKIKRKSPSLNTEIDDFVSKNIRFTSKALFMSDFKRFERLYKPQAYIVGSDQVWRGDYIIFPEANFLSFTNCSLKIAYAASFGIDRWGFSGETTQKLVDYVQCFKAISVREVSGIGICKNILKKDAVLVLDPTMLLSKNFYVNIASSVPGKENVLVTYVLNMDSDKRTFILSVLSDLCCEEFPLNVPDKITIEEWLAAFRDAKLVVCDSFHGTAFSIIFEKPFIVLGNKERGNARLDSLLEMFGLEDRFLKNMDVSPSTLKPIDWNKVRPIRQKLIHDSLNFLKSNLNDQ